MRLHARGTFDVTLAPLAPHHTGEHALGRMSIDKTFHGDLEATSAGEMLAGMTAVKSSAAYVAIERVTGALGGREGSFLLQHTGVMHRGAPTLVVTVVPDSGTGDLSGLSGTMQIIVDGKQHSYVMEYTIGE